MTDLKGDLRIGQLDTELVLNFTHQIINPLNGVVGTLDNVIDGTITGERRDQRLRAVRAQLSHSIELVRNLAFLAQLTTEEGREGLRQKRHDVLLPQTIIEAAQFFQEVAKERAITIRLTNREDQYVVLGQKDLLRQVFINIFENGVKYGEAGTDIRIQMRPQRKTGQMLVEIRGSGPGFSYSEREHLFSRGFRGNAAKALVASGSGLGLYICHEILVLAHEASIEAEYSPNTRETLFRLRFPHFRVLEEEFSDG